MTYNESPSNESPSGWLQPITRSPDHYLTVIPSLVWCTIASAAVLCDWALSAYLLKVIKIFIVWRIMHLDLNKLQMHSRKLCSVFIYWQAFKGRALLKILSVPSPSIYNHLVLFWSLLLEFHCPNQPSQSLRNVLFWSLVHTQPQKSLLSSPLLVSIIRLFLKLWPRVLVCKSTQANSSGQFFTIYWC